MKVIVLTGAGCSGKSSIAKWLGEQYADKLIILNEIVEIFKSSSLPLPLPKEKSIKHRREYISLIVGIQNQLESFIRNIYGDEKKALVCDRGILDTIAYHPNPMNWFFEHKSSLPAELTRYDMILHLELCEEKYGTKGNLRPYSLENAKEHESILKKYYGYHEQYHFIKTFESIEEKYKHAIEILDPYLGLS